MTVFHVDSEAVAHASTAAQATISRISSEVASLHTHLTNLQGSWSGSASEAFQVVVGQWHHTAARIDESLTSISQALNLAAQQYTEIESATANMFRL
jgi:early secretory antigenic target protein ESAT-6